MLENRTSAKKMVQGKTSAFPSEPFRIIIDSEEDRELTVSRNDYYHLVISTDKIAVKEDQKIIKITEPFWLLDDGIRELNTESIEKGEGNYSIFFNTEMLDASLQNRVNTFLMKQKLADRIFILSEDMFYSTTHYLGLLYEEYSCYGLNHGNIIRELFNVVLAQLFDDTCAEIVENSTKSELSESFMSLLKTQFPIMNLRQSIEFKTPKDFARYFNIHVNHLNFELKRLFGKTTTQVIQESLAAEACALLKNSKWSISEIGRVLGFDYPQHFNAFFKKNVGCGPKEYRKKIVKK